MLYSPAGGTKLEVQRAWKFNSDRTHKFQFFNPSGKPEIGYMERWCPPSDSWCPPAHPPDIDSAGGAYAWLGVELSCTSDPTPALCLICRHIPKLTRCCLIPGSCPSRVCHIFVNVNPRNTFNKDKNTTCSGPYTTILSACTASHI